MTADTQAQWDHEATAAFRRRLHRLASDVRQAKQDELRLRDRKRGTARERARLDGDLALAIDSDADDAAYLAHLETATRAAEAAAEAETEARQQWQLQVIRRCKLQDELRVAIRNQFKALPLFDRQPITEETPAGAAARPRRRPPKETTP